MSGKKECSCLEGNCHCWKGGLLCTENCTCNDCKNNEDNKAEVDSKRKSPGDANLAYGCRCRLYCNNSRCSCFHNGAKCTSPKCTCQAQDCTNREELVEGNTNTEPGQGSKGSGSNVCRCRFSGCHNLRCSCFQNDVKCTSKCKCQDCINRDDLIKGNTKNETGQGSKASASNVPGKAALTTPSRGSGSSKRPRN